MLTSLRRICCHLSFSSSSYSLPLPSPCPSSIYASFLFRLRMAAPGSGHCFSSSSSSATSAVSSSRGRGSEGRGRRGRGRGWDTQQRRGAPGADEKIDALGRLLTKILRHMASELKLDVRSDGYVRVHDLMKLSLTTYANVPLKSHSVEEIKEAVKRDNKQRFSLLEEDGKLFIRANQGHTITMVSSDNLLKPIVSAVEVPVCVHGTYTQNLESILQSGLKRMARLHVHFASGLPTDGEVISGMRRNVNLLVYLDVRKALQDGMKLYISDNKVILTEGFDGVVPVAYFEKIETWPARKAIPFQT